MARLGYVGAAIVWRHVPAVVGRGRVCPGHLSRKGKARARSHRGLSGLPGGITFSSQFLQRKDGAFSITWFRSDIHE